MLYLLFCELVPGTVDNALAAACFKIVARPLILQHPLGQGRGRDYVREYPPAAQGRAPCRSQRCPAAPTRLLPKQTQKGDYSDR